MAVDLLMDASTVIKCGARNNIGIVILVDMNINFFTGVMTAFEFAIPPDEFRC